MEHTLSSKDLIDTDALNTTRKVNWFHIRINAKLKKKKMFLSTLSTTSWEKGKKKTLKGPLASFK